MNGQCRQISFVSYQLGGSYIYAKKFASLFFKIAIHLSKFHAFQDTDCTKNIFSQAFRKKLPKLIEKSPLFKDNR